MPTINRKELIEKLELVASAANPSSFVPEFQRLHFNKDILHASDGVVSADTLSPLPEQSFSIKSNTFLHLLQNISEDEITLDIKEKSLSVKTSKIEGKFKISSPGTHYPITPKEEKEVYSELLDALDICRFGASREKTSGAISGVRIEGSKVYSTDRYRAYQYDLGISSGVPSCTIPTKYIEIILKKKKEAERFGMTESGSFFMILKDGTRVSTTVYPDEYPELDGHFENIDTSILEELLFEEDLKKVLEKHLKSLLESTEIYDKEIHFDVSGKACILSSESKDSGNLVEEVGLEKEVGEFEIIINPALLYEVLAHSEGKFLYNPSEGNEFFLINAERLQVMILPKV